MFSILIKKSFTTKSSIKTINSDVIANFDELIYFILILSNTGYAIYKINSVLINQQTPLKLVAIPNKPKADCINGTETSNFIVSIITPCIIPNDLKSTTNVNGIAAAIVIIYNGYNFFIRFHAYEKPIFKL
jgi:hypothetical protein